MLEQESATDHSFTDSEWRVVCMIDNGDPEGACLREVSSRRILSFEDQLALIENIHDGWKAKEQLNNSGLNPQKREKLEQLVEKGEKAQDELKVTNLGLVVGVAKKHLNRGLALHDLIQEGTGGFDEAIEHFDPIKGNKFSTYAIWWIHQKIELAIHNQGRTIRWPGYLSAGIHRVESAEATLRQALGREPTDQEIIDEAKISMGRLRNIKKYRDSTIVQFSTVENEDLEKDIRCSGRCSGPRRPTEELALSRMTGQQIQKLVDKLPSRENIVLFLRFAEGLTFEEIGEKLRISKSRAEQLKNQALNRIKKEIVD